MPLACHHLHHTYPRLGTVLVWGRHQLALNSRTWQDQVTLIPHCR